MGSNSGNLDVAALMAQLVGDDNEEVMDKTASADVEADMEKLASDLRAAGAEMADAFVDTAIARFEKVAADKASSSHAAGDMTTGKWGSVVDRLARLHSMGSPDADAGQTRAEKVYPNIARNG